MPNMGMSPRLLGGVGGPGSAVSATWLTIDDSTTTLEPGSYTIDSLTGPLTISAHTIADGESIRIVGDGSITATNTLLLDLPGTFRITRDGVTQTDTSFLFDQAGGDVTFVRRGNTWFVDLDAVGVEQSIDLCAFNRFIHSGMPKFYLVFAHEGDGGTSMTVRKNGIPVTYQNLINANDVGNGVVGFGGGVNGNYNRRASTVEFLQFPGDTFEIVKPATPPYDAEFGALLTDPGALANTAADSWRWFWNENTWFLRDENNVQIAGNAGVENGTYKIELTLAVFNFYRNDVLIHEVECEWKDYSQDVSKAVAATGIMADAAPAWTGNESTANGVTNTISTGVDLSEVDEVRVTFGRTNGTWGKIVVPFDPAEIDFDIAQGKLLPHFGNTYLSIHEMSAADFAAGDIPFRALTGSNVFGFAISRIEFKKRMSTLPTSSRIGEFVHKKSAFFVDDEDAMAKGYLPVKSGTVPNGALDYPVWAAAYDEYVVGDDIVFPADVDGMFLRNLGGNAGVEGAYQADENKAHTHNYTRYASIPNNSSIGGSNGRWRGTSNAASTSSGGVEARPVNRSYQLYTIIDTYAG